MAFPLLLGAVLWATLAMAASSSQARISPGALTVTSTVDAVDADLGDGACDDGTGKCTLRAAIMEASSGDSIDIPAGVYTLTLDAELSIDKDLTMNGAGSGDTIIQADTAPGVVDFRVFNITGGTVAISGMTIRHGKVSGGFPAGDGGGIHNSGTLTLTNSTVSGNSASVFGGGILNSSTLTIANSTVNGNTADRGGGIYNRTGNTLTLTDSTVSGNSAATAGGGIHILSGAVTLTDSTVSGNAVSGDGGGIRNFGALTLTDSTVSGNTASGGGAGIRSSGTLTLTNGTITGNVAETRSGGGIRKPSGTVELISTIIADNTATTGPDCSGLPTSRGYNLIGDDSSCGFAPVTGDLVNADPVLGPLQGNGGPTFTHALLPGSPAIDAVPVGDCTDTEGNPNTTDQRGIVRPLGLACDIGAFERAFIVNSNDDIDDGVCDVSHCSLREAIAAANDNPGVDPIAFNIPSEGPHTIQPMSALPTITDPVIIDGYTQPGASPSTSGPGLALNTVLKIELDGTNAGAGSNGITITAGISTVRGLAGC